MKKKFVLLALSMMFAFSSHTYAQAVIETETEEVEDEDSQDEDDEDADDEDDDEEDIDVPESMEEDLDSILSEDFTARKYLSAEKDKGFSPTFDDQIYIDRLSRIPTVIELPYNEVVRRFIDRYANDLRHTVSYCLGAQNFYMPMFEQALEEYNLPLELKYLPVIESALKPTARSRVGATGIWQFMLATGKRYGLTVNSLVDERCDPQKASYAAARYLSDSYKRFGDWGLVIASYNCGPENVQKAITRAGGSKDYWEIYPYLPRETRGYVPAFIAANYIMRYYCEHNITPMKTTLPEKTDTVMLNRDVHMGQIAALCDISKEELHALNPQYRTDVVAGADQPASLRMPVEKIQKFLEMEDSIYNYMPEVFSTKRAIAKVNDVTPTYTPKKSKAKVRKTKGRKTRGKKARASKRSRGGRSVTVQRGQTLSQIAKKNHTTVAKLKKLNGIKGSNIRAGKKLRVK